MSESQTPKPDSQIQTEFNLTEVSKYVDKVASIVKEVRKRLSAGDYLTMVRASEYFAEVGLAASKGLTVEPSVSCTLLLTLIRELEREGFVVYAIAYEEGYIKIKAITPRK